MASPDLQPITTRGKKARGTLLVDIGCSSKRTPPSVSYYNKISSGHIGMLGSGYLFWHTVMEYGIINIVSAGLAIWDDRSFDHANRSSRSPRRDRFFDRLASRAIIYQSAQIVQLNRQYNTIIQSAASVLSFRWKSTASTGQQLQ